LVQFHQRLLVVLYLLVVLVVPVVLEVLLVPFDLEIQERLVVLVLPLGPAEHQLVRLGE